MVNLTVIVPLYNMEQYVEQCIMSIMNQTKQDIVILIVDDGSTDQSIDICKRLALTDRRIQILHQENGGLSMARYAGLKECKTEYVTFVDSDDFILKDAYEIADDAMQRHTDMILFEIARYYGEHNYKIEHCTIKEGFYDRRRIESEVYPKAVWNFEEGVPGIECSQCVRIVKTELLLAEYGRLGNIRIYMGEDAIRSFPMYLRIKNMEVIHHCYYMHRQREGKVAPYIESDVFFDEVYTLYRYLLEVMCRDNDYFRKQIEYYYICLVNYKKKKYGDVFLSDRFLFPFDKVPYGKKIVLYGAGYKGNAYYLQLEKLSYYDALLWVDQRAPMIYDERIKKVESIKEFDADYIVIAVDNKEICELIKRNLIKEYRISDDKMIG